MEDPENDESKKESTPQQIGPKCVQDALGAFLKPIRNGDPLVDFYTIYHKEASEYDKHYIKKYDEDLNTTLIFAGLFSTVSSAFIVDIYKQLQPDLNDQTAALLRALLLTLNHSTTETETTVPTIQKDPPNKIVIVNCLLYASLLISLLAALVAMLGKQWLNQYLRHAGGSMIERCGDRQQKFNGLQRWRFDLIIQTLPLMLQIALLLLACGLCIYLSTINTPVAFTLITLTGVGVSFYLGVALAGASSDNCPFRTPGSASLHGLGKVVGPRLTLIKVLVINAKDTLLERIQHVIILLRRLVTNSQQDPPRDIEIAEVPRGPHSNPSPNPNPPANQNPREPHSWLTLNEISAIQKKNSNNLLCVSWVLKEITDPEALEAAVVLAGAIWWFEDKSDVKPLYDLIISAFRTCFGPDGVLHEGLRDRAYYSGRAILWIHALAVCKSKEDAFPFPTRYYQGSPSDQDLSHLLSVFRSEPDLRVKALLYFDKSLSPPHLKWISGVLLHLSWAAQTRPDFTLDSIEHTAQVVHASTPLDALLNLLLMYCNLLNSPVGGKELKIQDKSDFLEQVVRTVSRAIGSALKTSDHRLIWGTLFILAQLKNRPLDMGNAAYGWCVDIWDHFNGGNDLGWKPLLLLSLEVGFRHLYSSDKWVPPMSTSATKHPGVFDTVLGSDSQQAVVDLIWASFMIDEFGHLPLKTCVDYISGRPIEMKFSPELRKTFILCVNRVDVLSLKDIGKRIFVESLNRLDIGIKDASDLNREKLAATLSEIVELPEAARQLAIQGWQLLAKFAMEGLLKSTTYNPDVAISLVDVKEWNKFECWLAAVWMAAPPGPKYVANRLGAAMEFLEKEHPGVLQQYMERWSEKLGRDVPEWFQQRYDPRTRLAQSRGEGPSRLPAPARSSSVEVAEAADSNEGGGELLNEGTSHSTQLAQSSPSPSAGVAAVDSNEGVSES